MLPQQIPDSLKRILKISLILTFVSAFTIFVIGFSAQSVHNEIKGLNRFLKDAANVQPNFEKSLLLYTEKTKDITEFLLKLRPQTESDFVQFISEVENIGQNLKLQLNMDSLENTMDSPDPSKFKLISYSVAFYGEFDDLIKFLYELEELNYFLKVEDVEFKNLKYVDNLDDKKDENIKLKINLFIK